MRANHRNRTHRALRKLAAYVGASAACAVGEADAGIVYTNFGPEGIPFAELDLDRDGLHDFEFFRDFTRDTRRFGCDYSRGISYCRTTVRSSTYIDGIRAMRANGMVVNEWNEVRALPRGETVDGNLRVAGAAVLAGSHFFSRIDDSTCDFGCSGGGSFGSFAGNRRAFVGLLLNRTDGSTRFGWAELESDFGTYRVFGVAYETEAETPILAGAVPEPPSLLLLAAGAAGMCMLRRRRTTHSVV